MLPAATHSCYARSLLILPAASLRLFARGTRREGEKVVCHSLDHDETEKLLASVAAAQATEGDM